MTLTTKIYCSRQYIIIFADATTLNHLFTNDRKFTSPWKNLEAKL
ncbi:unnamed protein product [Tenebrio molitor]|nr:unnamed protein product [Tenebrio molitor]